VPSSSFFVIKRERGGRKKSIPKLCCCCLLSSAQLNSELWMLYSIAAGVSWRFITRAFVCVCVLPGSLISIIIALLLSGKEMREGERKSLLTSGQLIIKEWRNNTSNPKEGVRQRSSYRYYTELSLLSYADVMN
jgi:hypothetical protein